MLLFRHMRWLVTVAATGLASFPANAQTPQTPLESLGFPSAPVSPAASAAYGPQAALFPAGPGVPPGSGAAPDLADPTPPVRVDVGPLGILPPPAPGSESQAPGTTPAPSGWSGLRVEPGRHLLEYRGSGVHGPYGADESDRWLDFSLLIQTEYIHNSPSSGQSTEQLFFRRLRPVVMAGMDDWQGIIELDFGAGQDGTTYNTAVRWVNLQYTGFYQAHVTFGSFKPWFSREMLTLGPHLQTIERSPVGDTNFGNPDYMIGLAWDQMLPNRKLAYYASVGLEDQVQNVNQMQMRSPAYVTSGANQGVLATGRVDYYLFGQMPYDPRPLHTPPQIAYNRGDFHTEEWRALVSAALYGWWNDDNSNPFTKNGASTSTTQADLNRAYGAEVSGGVRGFGFSGDVEYQHIRGDLLVSNFTGGLYVNGRTNMDKFSVTGGYMLPRDVELVSAWSVVGATGYARALSETKLGVNWYVKKYAIRFSATYSFENNVNGTPGNNLGVARALAQFVW